MQPHPILGGAAPPKPRQTTVATVIQGLAGLAQVAVAVAVLQLNTPRAWWLLGLGLALLALAFGGPLVRRIGAWRRRRHDDRVARRALPELRSLVRAFEKLITPGANDTLQAGLQTAFQSNHGMLDLLHVPSGHLFGEMLYNLTARLDSERSDAAHLLCGLAEFYTAVSAHSMQCIEPVFRTMPKEARDLLTPTARATLNSYRERYLDFHADFTTFVEDLGPSLRASTLRPSYYVFRPDALTT